jgi:ribosomal protein S27AE
MYVRQCTRCGVIDGREAFPDEEAAARTDGWVCEHCGSTAFEAVVMVDEDVAASPDDPYE